MRDAPRPDAAPAANDAPPRSNLLPAGRGGCALRVLVGVAVLIAIVVAIGTIFDQGENADQPVHGYDAGPLTAYPPGSVNYAEAQHLYIVRLPDGGVVALYDRSTEQQELGGSDCRVTYDETAGIGTLEPLPGTQGAFVEDCNNARTVWRVDGKLAFGSGYGDLDRFDTSVNGGGELIVDTSARTCTRSRGVIGIKPFDLKSCGAPEG